MFHGLPAYPRRHLDVSFVALEDLGSEASALGDDRIDKMARFDLVLCGNRGICEPDDFAKAGRDENAVPHTIVARTERSAHVAQNLGRMRARFRKPRLDARIVFLDQCE
jgi:hypothetical protein